MSGTEDSILNTIPDFQQDSGGADEAGSDTSGQSQGTPTQTTGDGGGRTSAQPTQTGGEGGQGQQPTQQRAFRRRHDGLIEQPNAENPKVRDLVDPVTGRTVATGGIERRVFEEGQRHARENQQLQRQVQQYASALQGISEVTREAARLNIAPQDQVVAIRVMSDFLRDPVATVQYLVEEVKSKGYQIPFLTQGVTPGMDMNAISRMIDNKMQPITRQSQIEEQNQRVRQQAERDLSAFLNDNEDAGQNLDVLTEMLQAQPSLTLHGAYTRMIRWAHENGLDWTQPLKPQVAALQGNGGQQPTHQPTTQQPSRPFPGRGVNGGQQAQPLQTDQRDERPLSENASWADIIHSAMRDSNVRFN